MADNEITIKDGVVSGTISYKTSVDGVNFITPPPVYPGIYIPSVTSGGVETVTMPYGTPYYTEPINPNPTAPAPPTYQPTAENPNISVEELEKYVADFFKASAKSEVPPTPPTKEALTQPLEIPP